MARTLAQIDKEIKIFSRVIESRQQQAIKSIGSLEYNASQIFHFYGRLNELRRERVSLSEIHVLKARKRR